MKIISGFSGNFTYYPGITIYMNKGTSLNFQFDNRFLFINLVNKEIKQ